MRPNEATFLTVVGRIDLAENPILRVPTLMDIFRKVTKVVSIWILRILRQLPITWICFDCGWISQFCPESVWRRRRMMKFPFSVGTFQLCLFGAADGKARRQVKLVKPANKILVPENGTSVANWTVCYLTSPAFRRKNIYLCSFLPNHRLYPLH